MISSEDNFPIVPQQSVKRELSVCLFFEYCMFFSGTESWMVEMYNAVTMLSNFIKGIIRFFIKGVFKYVLQSFPSFFIGY